MSMILIIPKSYRSEKFTIDMIADMQRIRLVPFEMWLSQDSKFTPEELEELSQYFSISKWLTG